MDAPASLHPTDQTLSAYGLGKLDESSARSVDEHLESCSECRQRVGALSGDSFLGRLREAHGSRGTHGRSQTDDAPRGRDRVSPEADSLPAELVNHPDFKIVRELGRGGMGVVYLAQNTLMGRLEVLKVVGRHLVERPGVLERFLREIRSAAKLQHPNIVTAYSAMRLGEGIVLAMEYVEGNDLARLVKEGGPLPVANACYFIYQAALGLQHAHTRGMVHRDIKPANLILAREGKRAVVKVLDFGLAKVTSEGPIDGGLTHEGQMLGTPDYISPEQTLDAQKADIRADIYSLGCTFYYLLTGAPPFRGSSLYDLLQAHQSMNARPLNLVRPEVPVELAALVAKMLAKEPARRFQTPGEVAQALTRFFKPGANPGSSAVAEAPLVSPAASLPKTDGAAPVAPTAKPAPEGVAWGSLIEFKETERSATGLKPKPARSKPAPDAPSPLRRRPLWFAGSVAAVSALLLGLVVAWGAGLIKVKTREGTIVLENYSQEADVFVDGEKIKVRWPNGGGGEAEITVPPGRHGVEVEIGGTRTFGQEVTVEAGKTQRLTVRLENAPGKTAAPIPKAEAAVAIPKAEAAVAGTPGGSVDLLSLLDPAQHTVSGRWRREGSALVSAADGYNVINIPYPLPNDYVIALTVERISGKNDLQLGFAYGEARGVVVIDGWNGRFSGLSLIDGVTANQNETAHPGQVIPDTGPAHIAVTVRKGQVLVTADGRPIVDWKADAARLSLSHPAKSDTGPFFLGVQNGGSYRIDAVTLTPLAVKPADPDPVYAGSITTSIGMNLKLIPSGTFEMGAADDEPTAQEDGGDRPRHLARITRPFFLGAHEVTQEQFRQVMGTDPSTMKGVQNLPVDSVSWFDAVRFCTLLSARENRAPYYLIVGDNVTIVGGDGYRLPTEAEWEYACRARTTTRYSFGPNKATLNDHAWTGERSGNHSHAVGQKRPNDFGLFDMNGNVSEWCWDWYDESSYRLGLTDDPSGPPNGTRRVHRGGSYSLENPLCYAASYRGRGNGPHDRIDSIGFRVARSVLPTRVGTDDPPTGAQAGFIPLFNGKDLTGWKPSGDDLSAWTVRDGAIVGETARGLSGLSTDRSDYADFHLRMEVRSNDRTNKGIAFRSDGARSSSHNYLFWTGGLTLKEGISRMGAYRIEGDGKLPNDGLEEITPPGLDQLKPGVWQTVEIIALGNTFRMRVEGREVSAFRDTRSRLPRGKIDIWLREGSGLSIRRVEIKELSTSAPLVSDAGFVPLFNGKDLTGWKTHPVQPGHWRVQDGILSDPGGTSHLYSERGDYRDFHLRVEARIGGNGNSGVYFRAPFGPYNLRNGQYWPNGYEAAINSYKNVRGDTGSLVDPAQIALVNVEGHTAPVDRWFVLEVIAEDNRLRVKVDGVTTADYTDSIRPHPSGHLALQSDARGGGVEFRKVEIKELSSPDGKPAIADAPKATSPLISSPGQPEGTRNEKFISLFNGNDLAGWTVMRSGGTDDEIQQPGEGGWAISDGNIWCMTRESGWLKSNRTYANFVLQLDFKPPKGVNSGVYIRCPDQGRLSIQGTEIQIIDDVNNVELKKTPEAKAWSRRTGSIHGIVGPSRKALRVGNQWNTLEIVCENDKIQVKLNGLNVVDADETRFAALKGRPRQGYVGLSNWHGQAYGMGFRNIRIKELK